MSEAIQYFNRQTHTVETEKVLGDGLLRLAYCTPARHVLSWPLFGFSACSRFLGWYANREFSRRKVASTIRDLQMDMTDFEIPPQGFRTFNEFFTRHVKPGARPFFGDGLCSPADGRLTVWPELRRFTCIPVKGAEFTVPELLGEPGAQYASLFEDGALMVCRLCPVDYHRYHFPASGQILEKWRLPGRYHSVNPLALAQNLRVFTTNVREVTMLELERFGRCAFIAVGAFGVASITDTHPEKSFQRGEEAGYFSFGGSTLILIFQKNRLRFDQDLLQRSATGMECLVKAGEPIASVVC